jgi:hypothetical protein
MERTGSAREVGAFPPLVPGVSGSWDWTERVVTVEVVVELFVVVVSVELFALLLVVRFVSAGGSGRPVSGTNTTAVSETFVPFTAYGLSTPGS